MAAAKRPGIITFICILGFIGAVLAIPLVFSDAAKEVGSWYPVYMAFSAIVGFVCMIGLWMMKKWGMLVYTALLIANQGVLYYTGSWNIMAFIIPLIIVIIGFSQYKKME